MTSQKILSPTTKSLIEEIVKLVAPPRKVSGSEWAPEFIFFPSDSPTPGRFSLELAPYFPFILDALSNPEVNEVTWQACSQVGKTTFIVIGNLFFAVEMPCPQMVVQPRIEDGQDYSQDKLMAIVRASPRLKNIFGPEKTRSSDNKILKKLYFGGFIKIGGANSPASLAGRTICILWLDEKDRFERSAGKEGDPSALAKKRTVNYHNSKVINTSTPTIKKYSIIEKDYERSDQNEFYCECPHCKERITLKFEQLHYDVDDLERSTVYICQLCDSVIEASYKQDLLATMIPIAKKPFKGHMGFKINVLYSPWVPWHKVVEEYLECKDDAEKMKVFTNTALGETWEINEGEKLDWEILYGRRESYEIGTVPMGGLFLTASADIQKNRIEVEVKAWGRGKQSYSIDHIVLPGMTRDDQVWKDLADVLNNTYRHASGVELPIRMMAVDSGYNTDKVYEFVRKFPRSKVIPIKGGPSTMITMVNPPKTVDVEKGTGKKKKNGPRVWIVGGDLIKSEFFGNLAKEKPTEDQLKNGGQYPSGYCHYPQYSEDFFKQLTAEVLVPRKGSGGQIIHEWQKLTNDSRNEAIDLHVYNRAVANILGIDRFKESHWASFEEQLGIDSSAIVAGKSEPKKPKTSEQKREKTKRNKVIVKGSGFLSR